MRRGLFLTFIFTLMLLFWGAKSAEAFISPTTLSLLAAALGGCLWGVLTILGVNVVLFFKKIRFRTIIRVVSLVIILVLILIVAQRYQMLRHLNAPQYSENDTESIVDAEGIYEVVPTYVENEIDLNTLPKEELAKYRYFQVQSTLSPVLTVKNATQIGQLDRQWIDDLPHLFDNLDKFVEEHNIKKTDKLLFVCEGGGSGSKISILFTNAGYNTHFASLKRLSENNDIFTLKFTDDLPRTTSLIVVPYDWRDKNKKDVMIDFDFIRIRNVLDWKQRRDIELIDYKDFTPEAIENKNLICTYNLHCLLTKYVLDYNGITKRRIYKIPIPAERYKDWDARTLKRIRTWTRESLKPRK